MAEMPLIHKNLGGPWAAHPCCDTKAIQKLHRATKDTTSTSAEISTEQEPDAGSLDVPPNWTGMDYAGCLICLPLAPLGAMLFPLLWITYAPAFLAGKIYLATCKRPVKIVERTCGFHFFSFFVFLLSFMGLILTFFYWIYLTVVVVSLSLIISILSGRIRLFLTNWALLKPYRHFPGWTWEDIVCVMMGAMDRQGYFEFLYRFPSVLLITPVLKYVFTTNPLIHDLSEQFINQWTVPLQMTEANVLASVVMDLSWTAHSKADRHLIDADPFSAHYPLPPPGRASNSVVGVQFTNILVNITKTTHNVTGENRSQSGKRGIFIVDLYFWNPCHLLTGVVEVNLQYRGGVEHPMWCVIGKNHWAVQLFKNVDNLFWRYAPSAATFFQGHGVEHVDPKQS